MTVLARDVPRRPGRATPRTGERNTNELFHAYKSPLRSVCGSFAVERDPTRATTGMLIRSYDCDMWVLRLDGDFDSVVPRLAELLARKERRPSAVR
jgi:hypothetical protein